MGLVIYFIILLSITTAILVSTRNTRYFPGVLAAACIYWLFMAAGTYHILISRSSTSGIGFLFIPIDCLLPALVGALGVALTTQKSIWIKALGGLVLAGLVPIAWFALQGIVETRQTNARRDAQRKIQYEAYVGYQKQLTKRSLMSPLGGSSSTGNTKGACQRLDVPAVKAIPWSMWSKTTRPPEGRWLVSHCHRDRRLRCRGALSRAPAPFP